MDEILLQEVKKRAFLYNQNLAEYRDQQARQKAWEEIGMALETSGIKAKKRWDKLRRCFCNARNRRRNSGKTNTPWRYQEQMAFIEPFVESKKRRSKTAAVSGNRKWLFESEGEEEVKAAGSASEEDDTKEDAAETQQQQQQQQFAEAYEARLYSPDPQAAADSKHDSPASLLSTKRPFEFSLSCSKLESDGGGVTTSRPQRARAWKESSPAKKLKGEAKKSPEATQLAAALSDDLDDTDMFFLSMARMTKKLPRVQQARIKLALSTSVLTEEVRCSERS